MLGGRLLWVTLGIRLTADGTVFIMVRLGVGAAAGACRLYGATAGDIAHGATGAGTETAGIVGMEIGFM